MVLLIVALCVALVAYAIWDDYFAPYQGDPQSGLATHGWALAQGGILAQIEREESARMAAHINAKRKARWEKVKAFFRRWKVSF